MSQRRLKPKNSSNVKDEPEYSRYLFISPIFPSLNIPCQTKHQTRGKHAKKDEPERQKPRNSPNIKDEPGYTRYLFVSPLIRDLPPKSLTRGMSCINHGLSHNLVKQLIPQHPRWLMTNGQGDMSGRPAIKRWPPLSP